MTSGDPAPAQGRRRGASQPHAPAYGQPAGELRRRLALVLARGALGLAMILAVHLAILADQADLAVAALLWGLALAVLLGAWQAPPRSVAVRAALALVLAGAGGLQAGASAIDPRIALVLPFTLGNLAVSGVFAYTLLPGHEPAIVRVARVSRGEVPSDLAGHARAVTRLWAVLPAGIAAAALLALAVAGIQAWSWIANFANPAILIAVFLGEHAVRQGRFPQYGPASLRRTLTVMLDKRAWPLPQRRHG
jgi:uncharacterized membrane protein